MAEDGQLICGFCYHDIKAGEWYNRRDSGMFVHTKCYKEMLERTKKQCLGAPP